MAKKLTALQKRFIEFYLQCWNATEATVLAGYKCKNRKVAASIGAENLAKLEIQAEIQRRLSEVVMASDEVLARLSYMARGFDPAEYMEMVETYTHDSDGSLYVSGLQVKLDLERLRADGFSRLIKSVRNTSNGPVFEFYDQQSSLQLVGKNAGLFRDRVEHTGRDGKPIGVIILPANERNDKDPAAARTPDGVSGDTG